MSHCGISYEQLSTGRCTHKQNESKQTLLFYYLQLWIGSCDKQLIVVACACYIKYMHLQGLFILSCNCTCLQTKKVYFCHMNFSKSSIR
jgi:hypothetical protein